MENKKINSLGKFDNLKINQNRRVINRKDEEVKEHNENEKDKVVENTSKENQEEHKKTNDDIETNKENKNNEKKEIKKEDKSAIAKDIGGKYATLIRQGTRIIKEMTDDSKKEKLAEELSKYSGKKISKENLEQTDVIEIFTKLKLEKQKGRHLNEIEKTALKRAIELNRPSKEARKEKFIQKIKEKGSFNLNDIQISQIVDKTEGKTLGYIDHLVEVLDKQYTEGKKINDEYPKIGADVVLESLNKITNVKKKGLIDVLGDKAGKRLKDKDVHNIVKDGLSNITKVKEETKKEVRDKKGEIILKEYEQLKAKLPKNLGKHVSINEDFVSFEKTFETTLSKDPKNKKIIDELRQLQKQYHFKDITTSDIKAKINSEKEKVKLYQKSLSQFTEKIDRELNDREKERDKALKEGRVEEADKLNEEIQSYEYIIDKLKDENTSGTEKRGLIGIMNSSSWLKNYDYQKSLLSENPDDLYGNVKGLKNKNIQEIGSKYSKSFGDYIISKKLSLLEDFAGLKSEIVGGAEINLKTNLGKFLEDNKNILSKEDELKVRKLIGIRTKLSKFNEKYTKEKEKFIDSELSERKLAIEFQYKEIEVLDKEIEKNKIAFQDIKSEQANLDIEFKNGNINKEAYLEQTEKNKQRLQELKNIHRVNVEEKKLRLNSIKRDTEKIEQVEKNINKALSDNLFNEDKENQYINNYAIVKNKQKYKKSLKVIKEDIKNEKGILFGMDIDIDKNFGIDLLATKRNLSKLEDDKKIVNKNRIKVAKDILLGEDDKESIYKRHEKIDTFLYGEKVEQLDGSYKRTGGLLGTGFLGIVLGLYTLLDKITKGAVGTPTFIRKIEEQIHNSRLQIFFFISVIIFLTVMTGDKSFGSITLLNPSLYSLGTMETGVFGNADIKYSAEWIKPIVENLSLFINFMGFIVLYQILIDFLFNYIKILKNNIDGVMGGVFFSLFKILLFIGYFGMLFLVSKT